MSLFAGAACVSAAVNVISRADLDTLPRESNFGTAARPATPHIAAATHGGFVTAETAAVLSGGSSSPSCIAADGRRVNRRS
jgi:hypothetical protein